MKRKRTLRLLNKINLLFIFVKYFTTIRVGWKCFKEFFSCKIIKVSTTIKYVLFVSYLVRFITNDLIKSSLGWYLFWFLTPLANCLNLINLIRIERKSEFLLSYIKMRWNEMSEQTIVMTSKNKSTRTCT